jgi:hypothetical protein
MYWFYCVVWNLIKETRLEPVPWAHATLIESNLFNEFARDVWPEAASVGFIRIDVNL